MRLDLRPIEPTNCPRFKNVSGWCTVTNSRQFHRYTADRQIVGLASQPAAIAVIGNDVGGFTRRAYGRCFYIHPEFSRVAASKVDEVGRVKWNGGGCLIREDKIG